MNTSTPMTGTTAAGTVSDGVDKMAGRIERNLQDVQQAAADAVQTMTKRVEDIRATTSDAVSRAGTEAGDLAHRGLARTREAIIQARDSASHLRDDTARRVRDDPMKALLIAAAAGAASAIVVQWLSRSRRPV